MAATTVFLVRHGAHDLLGHRVAGRMPDVRLNPDGQAQARRAAARLARERVAAVYSSPLERARETAEPIAGALGLAVAIAPDVNELDYGDWTGQNLEDLASDPRWQDWNLHRSAARIPGGETMAAVARRGAAAVACWRLAHPDASVVATTHGDLIRSVVCGVLGLSLDNIHAFDVEPGSLSAIVVWEGGGKVVTLNEIPA